MATLSEADVEAILLDQLAGLGYACLIDTVSGPDGAAPEREAYSETVLLRRLRAAVDRLNPQIPAEAREDAVRRVIASERPALIEENRRLHRYLTEGVPVEFRAADGSIRGDAVRLAKPAQCPEGRPWCIQMVSVGTGDARTAKPSAGSHWRPERCTHGEFARGIGSSGFASTEADARTAQSGNATAGP